MCVCVCVWGGVVNSMRLSCHSQAGFLAQRICEKSAWDPHIQTPFKAPMRTRFAKMAAAQFRCAQAQALSSDPPARQLLTTAASPSHDPPRLAAHNPSSRAHPTLRGHTARPQPRAGSRRRSSDRRPRQEPNDQPADRPPAAMLPTRPNRAAPQASGPPTRTPIPSQRKHGLNEHQEHAPAFSHASRTARSAETSSRQLLVSITKPRVKLMIMFTPPAAMSSA